MAHFAQINEENLVEQVLVISNDLEHRGAEFLAVDLDLGGTWIQTSYNGNFRKNFAGIGYKYDAQRDAFIAPKPEDSIGFDEESCQWIVPVKELNEAETF
jgi:hypothetical protein